MLKVLVACEFSGVVRDAFARLGHNAWSCDILPSETEGNHIQGDVQQVLRDGWDLVIAHPPCTYLCNSGVCHLETDPSRWAKFQEAANFFNTFLSLRCAVAVENPIQHGYARAMIPKQSQIIQPWQFGHGETKATCLWLRGLPLLRPTCIVSGRVQRSHWESPSPERWKNRSRTYLGIGKAMAEQWGNYLLSKKQRRNRLRVS